ncbi:trypsin-like peptidase domain-containing protein [Pseudooceanicola sp.]|uniref:trypsin-like peptidase domain-containing protein n=1 Tax=Pseudooceanicola sp. TaxID=1914328 RepID=UPI0035C681FB
MTPLRPWITAALALCLTLATALWVAARAPEGAGDMTTALDATLILRSTDGAEFLGSAFLWRGGEIAVTNAHVLAGHGEVEVTTRDNRTAVARVTRRDDKRDIALLALPASLGPGLSAAPVPDLGAPVLAIGAPLEAGFTLTRGILSAHRQVLPAVPLRFLQHDAAINPGSSGGPLLNMDGELIGMNTRIADGSRYYVGISYAVPAPLIAALIAGDLPPVPDLGLALRPMTPVLGTALGIEHPTGLLLDDVTPDSPAEAAGLLPGDILIRAADRPLVRVGDLAMIIDATASSLPLLIRRGAGEITIPLALPRPAPVVPHPTPTPLARSLHPTPVPLRDFGVTLSGQRVIAIDDTLPAYAAGLAKGDVIEAVGQKAFTGQRLILPALLRVRRDGGTTHILIDPTRRRLRPLGGGNALDPDVTLF